MTVPGALRKNLILPFEQVAVQELFNSLESHSLSIVVQSIVRGVGFILYSIRAIER